MLDGGEAPQRLAADSLGRAVRRHQLGVLGLELRQAAHHAVVFAVADLGLGLDIIQVIMPVQLGAKLGRFRVRSCLVAMASLTTGGFGLGLGREPGVSRPSPERRSPA